MNKESKVPRLKLLTLRKLTPEDLLRIQGGVVARPTNSGTRPAEACQ